MKGKFTILSIFLLFACSVLFIACTKEGPAGPAGQTGPAGPAGPTGATGPQGPAGTANVFYSDWIDTVRYQGTDSTGWAAVINAPQLVDSIINRGDIKVYVNYGSDSADAQLIAPLPIYDAFLAGAIINAYFAPQTILLTSTADASSFTLRGYNHFQYRYILIPGGTAAGRYANLVNWNNYAEVKKYLRLKD